MKAEELPSQPSASGLPVAAKAPSGRGRIAAVVALSLLEVIRNRDLPTEILGSEDPSQTMPRRLGLSEAVELQIGRYRGEVRRRRRISEEETRDLFSLVLRRPDSGEVFFQVGEMLAGKDTRVSGLRRVLPARIRYALARRQFQREIRSLFGRDIGGFSHGRFTIEGRGHLLLGMDPGGDACALLTGFAQTILSGYFPSPVQVVHSHCEARKHDLCRWAVTDSS